MHRNFRIRTLGSFGARALDETGGRFDMLASVLLVGYAAGVAAGTALRPRISIASLLLAILPATIVLACTPDVASRMTAFALCAFLAGGVRSVVERYRSQSDRTTAGTRWR